MIRLRDIVCLSDGKEDDIDLAILDFSINLIKHSDFQKIRSVIKYFSGIKGYKLSESRWRRPAEHTPTLAALQFCIRVIGLEYALPTNQRDTHIYNPESTPLTIFREFHGTWLADGTASPTGAYVRSRSSCTLIRLNFADFALASLEVPTRSGP